VDRFNQRFPNVKAVLLYGTDNPVDGAVLDVLLRKAKKIHKSLGVAVPVPMDSTAIMKTVLKTLFDRQLTLGDFMSADELEEVGDVKKLHKDWDLAAERERKNPTRYAQRTINPDEVMRELNETDSVLGDPAAVKSFVLNAFQRLQVDYTENRDAHLRSSQPATRKW